MRLEDVERRRPRAVTDHPAGYDQCCGVLYLRVRNSKEHYLGARPAGASAERTLDVDSRASERRGERMAHPALTDDRDARREHGTNGCRRPHARNSSR